MSLVLDVSIAAAWAFDDETTMETEHIAFLVEDGGAVVPAHFAVELANILLTAERKKRISPAGLRDHMALLGKVRLKIDNETSVQAGERTADLARSETLSVQAAAYLELALRLGLPLATLDSRLVSAAHRCGVTVLP